MSKSVSFTINLMGPSSAFTIVRRGSTSDEDEDEEYSDVTSSGRSESVFEEKFEDETELYSEEDDDEPPRREEECPRFCFRLPSRDDQAIDEFNCLRDDSYEYSEPATPVKATPCYSVCSAIESGIESGSDHELSASPEPLSTLESTSIDISRYLRDILKWLPFKERVKCERVSRSWQRIAQEVNRTQRTLGLFGGYFDKIQNFCPQATHRVHPGDCVEINWYTEIQAVLKKVPHLRALHIRCEGSPVFKNEGDPESIGRLCPKLEHLSFVDEGGINIYDDIMKVITTSSTIRHLQLRFPYKASSSITDQLALESMIVKRALYVYNRGLEILSINVPLNEEHCSVLASFCKLRKLALHGTTIPVQGLNVLFKDGNLCGKYMRCLSMVVDSSEQLATVCKNLTGLQSFHCVVNNESKKMNMKSISWLGQLKCLKNLFLSCWTDQICDEGMAGIIMGCSQLTSLTVNADVGDRSLQYIGQFCPLIERLEINNGQANIINDQTITCSISYLERLRYFTLYYCNITDEAIDVLLDCCKDLELISITYSARLTEQTLKSLARFAREKPWERVVAVMPRALTRYRHVIVPLPRNLTLQFVK